ncbi:unnamed protein product [Schistocephalus solidus]|uniref:Bestrophin homolog n=1 Tax=Schistocephalus solidus TaxID=70667 RepID=A0A183T553_SCHSO|nr:unnamed protein product [Schistocephalus solidus]
MMGSSEGPPVPANRYSLNGDSVDVGSDEDGELDGYNTDIVCWAYPLNLSIFWSFFYLVTWPFRVEDEDDVLYFDRTRLVAKTAIYAQILKGTFNEEASYIGAYSKNADICYLLPTLLSILCSPNRFYPAPVLTLPPNRFFASPTSTPSSTRMST